MGKVVLHIEKSKGNDAGTTGHIERKVIPPNADPAKIHLNRELIKFPVGVKNRTYAIDYRIKNANIKRKIGNNQVRALKIMLSGSPDDMHRIQKEGRLNNWCLDNVKWLQDTFGVENLVSATLHLDEVTPHIHATVVPIVKGERRKAALATNPTKKKYKKKKVGNRLCADDVMTKEKLEHYQDSYAEKMKIYGLERGVRHSQARHRSTREYYVELFEKNELLRKNIGVLEEEKNGIYDKIKYLYNTKEDLKEEYSSVVNILNPKKNELSTIENNLQIAKTEYQPYKGQEELDLVLNIFPQLMESLRIIRQGKQIGLTMDILKLLFRGKDVKVSGRLYSIEHDQNFQGENVIMKLQKDTREDNKLKLTFDGMNMIDWFRKQKNGIPKGKRFKL